MQAQIFCFLINHEHKLDFGRFTHVIVSADTDIYDLTEMVRVGRLADLAHVDADRLEVWKYNGNDPAMSKPRTTDRVNQSINRIEFSENSDTVELLDSAQNVMSLNLPKDPFLLVRVLPLPPQMPATDEYAADKRLLDSDLVREYRDTFIIVKTWDSFDSSYIDLNNIWEVNWAPDFVAEFERILDSKPGLAPDVHTVINHFLRDSRSRAAYFELPEDSTVKGESHEKQPWRSAGHSEVLHIASLASLNWENFWQGTPKHALDKRLVQTIFFFNLLIDVPDSETTVHLGDTPLPFDLVMKRGGVQSTQEQLRTFKPRNALVISKSTLPRLLVDVQSTTADDVPPELARMLLEGAAVVRFANISLDTFKAKKDFILVAVFVWNDGRVFQYSLFQRQHDNAVYFKLRVLGLSNSAGRVQFASQLYNILHMPGRDSEEAKDTTAKVQLLIDRISKHNQEFPMKSFYKTKKERAGMSDSDDDDDDAGDAGAADCVELRAHGYEMKQEVILDDNGGVMEQRPPNILIVHQSSKSSKELIAKRVRKRSNELEIFKHLNTIQPKSKYVISLVDSFRTQSRAWAILPKMDSVAYCVKHTPTQISRSLIQVCWALIDGLAYLHGLRIAHRDIKPDNLLVDRDFCLKIADFDIAMQVKDEDEEINDQCGTKDWMAPEVENKSSTYSPIKADRWSCGRVLLYLLDRFLNEDPLLRVVGRELKAHDPKRRPPLPEWTKWQDVASIRDTCKRKVSRPVEDTIEVDEDMEPPKAKKPRVSRRGQKKEAVSPELRAP